MTIEALPFDLYLELAYIRRVANSKLRELYILHSAHEIQVDAPGVIESFTQCSVIPKLHYHLLNLSWIYLMTLLLVMERFYHRNERSLVEVL